MTLSHLLLLCLLLCGCSTTLAPVFSPDGTQSKADRPDKERKITKRSGARGQAGHMVEMGETLYSIAWKYGYDYKDVSRWNSISPPYVIYPGQSIRLRAPPATTRKQAPASTKKSKKKTVTDAKPSKRGNNTGTAANTRPLSSSNPKWHWPTAGRLVKLDSPTSKKGVNIGGSLGQAIKAAANGDVVYSGSGLLGYGKLIIIKHNETFLSAYAHNSDILVKEGERVTVGQKIATMGLGNNGMPVLHFEIRKNGKPVDPLKHLPDKRS